MTDENLERAARDPEGAGWRTAGEPPGHTASDLRARVRPGFLISRLPALALEALMVVFAVLVALGVEEWREQRQMAAFAERVRSAVLAEVDANLEEFRTTRQDLRTRSEILGQVMAESDISPLEGNLTLRLPEFSSAAWSAAQVSQVAPHLDYEWMIAVSRAYESYAIYSRISERVIDAMSLVMGGEPTLDGIRAIHGRLLVLIDVHDQVMERLEIVSERGEAGGR
jgi:hypothetical protein